MEKDYCNFSDLEPMEKIMYYNSLYMFLSQLNINTPGFAKKYNEMFNSDLTLKAGYEIAICEVDYSIVGVLITVDADESCEPYVLDGYKGIGIEEQLSDMMQRAYARLHQTRTWFPTPTHASNYLQTDGQTSLITKPSASLPDFERGFRPICEVKPGIFDQRTTLSAGDSRSSLKHFYLSIFNYFILYFLCILQKISGFCLRF